MNVHDIENCFNTLAKRQTKILAAEAKQAKLFKNLSNKLETKVQEYRVNIINERETKTSIENLRFSIEQHKKLNENKQIEMIRLKQQMRKLNKRCKTIKHLIEQNTKCDLTTDEKLILFKNRLKNQIIKECFSMELNDKQKKSVTSPEKQYKLNGVLLNDIHNELTPFAIEKDTEFELTNELWDIARQRSQYQYEWNALF